MAAQSPVRVFGAVLVVGLAIVCASVISLGFIMPEQLFESGIGVLAFFVAGAIMVVCAAIANLYDLRGILHEAFS